MSIVRHHSRRDRPRARPRRRTRARAGLAAATAVGILVAGCASFPDSAPSFTAQPSLRPNVATLVTPTPQTSSSHRPSTSTTGTQGPPSGQRTTSTATSTADPCAPSMPPVIATCLAAPWGLAPLPDGTSALVGERTTGKILRVAPGKRPELVATVTGLDTSGGGGLLGIALSPYYTEDGLIYAYVTTEHDNRILRIAPGQPPKAIFTGIPRGGEHNGGPIAFGADDLLYVATGNVGDPSVAQNPSSLAGKVLRLDAFGKPATGRTGSSVTGTSTTHTHTTSTSTTVTSTTRTSTDDTASVTGTQSTHRTRSTSSPASSAGAPPTGTVTGTQAAPAVYAAGFTDPTGICPLPGGDVGVVDHRGSTDLLIPVEGGADYSQPESGDTLWQYHAGDGGAVDCAVSNAHLLATSLAAEKVTDIQMTPTGGFTGSPQNLAVHEFGRLRTIVTGPAGLVWMTTSNRDGHGTPIPSDDRVVVLPAGGGGGGGGGPE